MRRAAATLWALLCLASPALAHDADLIFVRFGLEADGGVHQVATLTGATLALLAPVDLDGDGVLSEDELPRVREAVEAGFWESVPLSRGDQRCALVQTEVLLQEGFVELRAQHRCPGQGPLRQQFRILSVLPDGYRVILGAQAQGEVGQRFAEGRQQTLYLELPPEENQGPSSLAGWLWLGAEHIFQGYDHLAFLVALLLVASSWKRLLWMVTAFTVAHSITLGVTALGWVTLSPLGARWVELAIAASVVFVAVENLIGVRERYRPVLTFAFGLIHGFGFASVLAQYGLGDSAALALAGFNLGVELGQAVVVALLFPLVRLIARRDPLRRRVVTGTSLLIAALGGYWLVARAFG